ncbi:hypothetical protein CEUSTIGMA_g13105.t1 [Chlamydomonas eustigma]|uniref:Uncharacterized protein n=1 Tax=Chlamydomonas eustigma TaxID=1157962 RepID=A0A250XSB2_9CHLO|nr:hypothetical protein CEUSTIGMA_g13105.t1 [Chlamydomonas eustigma]|eukprot:GAX85690.1 hypothetical protein CEUSTIGMA_g13105.t1 [Chlamydomonas eustigma]
MSNRFGLVRGISEKSSSLTRELDSLADRAFELQQIAQALKEKDDVHMVDKGVQADSAGGVPAFKWERLKRLQPFQYLPFNKKLDWRKVRTMNVDKMIREGDSRSLMDMFNELVRVCQLMMQFEQYKSEQQYNMQQMMEEDQSELQAHVSLLPNMDLDKLTQGLHKLEMDYSGVADADMDAMFQQVRVEERIGARDVLGGIVDQANKELNERIKALGE